MTGSATASALAPADVPALVRHPNGVATLELGQGPVAAVLLHGIGGGKAAWPAQLPALAAHGYRAVAWDMPGYGDSAMIDPYDFPGLATALAPVLAAERAAGRRVVLVGHSMGGMVAQETCAATPALVDGMVLSGTSAAFGKPDGNWQREFVAARTAPLDAGRTMAELAVELVRGMVAPDAPADGVRLGTGVMGAVPAQTYRAALHALVRFDRREALARIAVPVLLLAGEHDRNAAPAVMERMAPRIADAEYRCLPQVGHLANMERPDRFNAALLDFLQRRFPCAERHAPPSGGPMQLEFTPAVGEAPFTADQARLLSLANRLGRERFAPRAAQWDREASFPFANYDDLREAGLLALCVPRTFGGEGADFATYCMLGAEIGRFCGATALTWNMHICSTMWTGVLADGIPMTAEQRTEHEARRVLHFERVVRDGAIYAQPFSEGSAAAAGKAPFGTTARKVEGGWVLNGRKIFASLSGAADYYGILCTEDRGDQHPNMRDTLYIAVPATAPGVTVTGEWDPMGMRGTVSRTLLLQDVFVADDEQLMPRGVYYKAAQTWPAMFFTLSPTYLGIAQAAYDFTVQYLRGEVPGQPPVKRRMYPTKQIAVAQMRIQLESMRSLFWRVIHEAGPNPSRDQRLRLYAAHYSVMEGANDIARLAIRTCGGQSMLKDLPLERLYRDSRCGALMLPWTAELILDRMGRETLYQPGERDE